MPMLTSESYCITPYISLKKTLSLNVVELNLDAKSTDLHSLFRPPNSLFLTLNSRSRSQSVMPHMSLGRVWYAL